VDEIVRAVLDGIRAKDWPTVRAHLHPYLHWHRQTGEVRGRNRVLELLKTINSPQPPTSFEVRDGQIYRWWT
jgi:hypothetical protein